MISLTNRRAQRGALLWSTLVAGMAACSGDGPSSPSPRTVPSARLVPCAAPALDADVEQVDVSPADLRDALVHAARTLAPSISDHASGVELIDALEGLATTERLDREQACRLVTLAKAELSALPTSSELASDADHVRLVLQLATQMLDALPAPEADAGPSAPPRPEDR